MLLSAPTFFLPRLIAGVKEGHSAEEGGGAHVMPAALKDVGRRRGGGGRLDAG